MRIFVHRYTLTPKRRLREVAREGAPRNGLMTHVLYEPDLFIERIERDGARLLAPRGTGIGFDELLEALPWKTLR